MKQLPLLMLVVVTLAVAMAPARLGAEPAAGKGIFTFACLNAHNHLDPQKISWLHDIRILDCLLDPLVRVAVPSLELEPACAEKWEVSADRLTYTFHLRAEAKWSNGDPVTSHDFVYAWRRAVTPDLAADYTQLLYCIKGAEDFFNFRAGQLKEVAAGKMTAEQAWKEAQARFEKTVGLATPDDHTLVVTLARPTAYFLQLCSFVTFYPVHARSVEAVTHLDAGTGMLTQDSTYWTTPEKFICNGPYVMQTHRFKRDMTLSPNPDYWNAAKVANGGIVEKIVNNAQTQLLLFDRGEVDWLPDIPTSSPMAADLLAQNRADVHTCPAAGMYFFDFNCLAKLEDGSKNPLADGRVRRALSMAIDRKTIVDQVTRLHQPVALTFVPPNALPGYTPPAEAGVSFNVEQARKLLAEAGYPGGQGLNGLSILYNTGAGHENMAQQIKRDWEQNLGVAVSLDGVELRQFSERLKQHQYTIARANWFGDYRDPTTFLNNFVTDNGNNDTGYSNPKYDALLRAAGVELDAGKRFEVLRSAEAMMLHDQPMAPVFQYIDIYLYDAKKVSGLEPNAWKFRRLDQVVVHH